MKRLLLSFASLSLLVPAQDTPPQNDPAAEAEVPAEAKAETEARKPQYILDLESLTAEEKQEYQNLFIRADSLFKQKRIFECLEVLEELHEIYDKNPATLNLQGACYVEFRAFDKARVAFAKTEKASPNNFNVRFNLAEIEFVSENFDEALKKFEALLDEGQEGEINPGMLPILKFKTLLCRLKADDVEGARELISDLDFLDDSPLYYYGNAALAYHAGEGRKAEQWLGRVSRIFRDNPSLLAPWQDTLIEFGYIKSFYGGDLEVENSSIPGAPEVPNTPGTPSIAPTGE